MKFVAVIALLFCFASPAAFALRCGSRVISSGDQDFKVRSRCGDPLWIDEFIGYDVIGNRNFQQQIEVQVQVWYYNFGPSQLMRRLRFRNGVLADEETLGYGVNTIGDNCDANLNYTGLSVGELIARCGQPATRRGTTDTIGRRIAPGFGHISAQRREDWIYDFGGNSFMRMVHLVDGQVTGVSTLPR
ncbi:MAG: DUF2845 domain-containing protein [Dokdonella sp.]